MFKNKKRIRAAWLKGLMFGRALGAKNERERIVELLEAECERPLDPKWSHFREECSCAQIALIKGEK